MSGHTSGPWWWPRLTDGAWLARIREDYPEEAHRSDEGLRDYYADGRKYDVLWDHVGDAYEQFEPLADAALEMLEAARAAVEYDNAIRACADDPDKMSSHCTAEGDDLDTLYFRWLTASRAGIAKAEGKK